MVFEKKQCELSKMAASTEARWQTQVTSLRQGIKKIYENKDLSDAVFKVKDQCFEVHKLILAARSDEFARILLDPNVPEQINVTKDHITPCGFEILLRYIYTDDIGTENKKEIIQAYLAAEYYHQKALLDECKRKIESWTIAQDEVCELLDAGLQIPKLRDTCIELIRRTPEEVISAPSFRNISPECLNIILESGALNSVPVMIYIDRIMEWATKEHRQHENYRLVRKDIEQHNLLGKLRIETLGVTDFAAVVGKYRELLTAEEVESFVGYFGSKDASVLPSWCTPAT